jgi:hypothetical protein
MGKGNAEDRTVTLVILILAVVLAVLLWNPEAFTRVRLFKGFGLKLELGDVNVKLWLVAK